MTAETREFPLDALENGAGSVDYPREIETVIASLADNGRAMVGMSPTGHAWKFKYGSVEVFVQLTGGTEDDMLTIWSPILTLPTRDDARLMRKLLEMNWQETFESRFAIDGDKVIVVASRTVADLNPSEISRAITVVATIADDNDDVLIAEFQNPQG